jgi:hypothetical protein
LETLLRSDYESIISILSSLIAFLFEIGLVVMTSKKNNIPTRFAAWRLHLGLLPTHI